ncbi:MAG: hypothetical protein M1834_008808 [Cirrosporium novae-zelandiae]|nr:MAG: hypothetical protein M1834_008808 [Cirrosporium novae-zelandiae]
MSSLQQQQKPSTEGSPLFNPDEFFLAWRSREGVDFLLEHNEFREAIIKAFRLMNDDSYVYHAIASVTLAQVQYTVTRGRGGGLHAWYLDGEGNAFPNPPSADITAYTSIFSPSKSAPNLLKSLKSNAKKNSLRASIASHLLSARHISSSYSSPKPKKSPNAHINPYYDMWCWSCQNLEWGGPNEGTVNVKTSHHILPIFMHHFGCAVPSYECLEIIRQVTRGKSIVDMGSGNGYWTYLLRRQGMTVLAVDNEQSVWRTMWIGDTIVTDGIRWLRARHGSKDDVLLLVYPVVGGYFTAKILETYQGNAVCVVGTQNGNGYTAFKDKTIEKYMEGIGEWDMTVRIAIPSFAGKDDALFVFERKEGGQTT